MLQGHSNFVAAVCVLPPDDNYPQGLVATGSNDSTILLFAPGQLQHVAKLTGHTNTGDSVVVLCKLCGNERLSWICKLGPNHCKHYYTCNIGEVILYKANHSVAFAKVGLACVWLVAVAVVGA